MSARSWFVPEDILAYIENTTVHEIPAQRALRAETAKLPQGRMQTGADQVALLAFLVSFMQAKRCIEVGVFTGYSSLGVARALPPDGRIVACDVSEEYTAIAQRYWEMAGLRDKIDLRLAPATQTLDAMIAAGESGTYDFAYIDADKTSYDTYYERVLKLLRLNGLIAIDNVLWGGDVARAEEPDDDTRALRALNEKIAGDSRVASIMLSIGDGLTLVRKAAA